VCEKESTTVQQPSQHRPEAFDVRERHDSNGCLVVIPEKQDAYYY
jgi:hypothetical protein